MENFLLYFSSHHEHTF